MNEIGLRNIPRSDQVLILLTLPWNLSDCHTDQLGYARFHAFLPFNFSYQNTDDQPPGLIIE